jgi:cell division protein FtsB
MSTSDMYIEKLARERLGFIKQGETPVINIKN